MNTATIIAFPSDTVPAVCALEFVRGTSRVERARAFFPNGYGISVVRGGALECGYEYEIAVLKGDQDTFERVEDTPVTTDVVRTDQWSDVDRIYGQIRDLPPVANP